MFLLPLTFAIIFSFQTCFWASHSLKQKTSKWSITFFLELTSFCNVLYSQDSQNSCLHVPSSPPHPLFILTWLLPHLLPKLLPLISSWTFLIQWIIFSHQNTWSHVDMLCNFLSLEHSLFLVSLTLPYPDFALTFLVIPLKNIFCLKLCLILTSNCLNFHCTFWLFYILFLKFLTDSEDIR